MGKQVDKYIKECETCQKIISNGRPNQAELIPIFPKRINEVVAIDLAGPLPRTVRGNRYFIILTDLVSKYLVCLALTNKETKAITNIMLEDWCWTFGIPKRY